MMSDRVVRLTFPAKAEYLLLARLTLSGLARELPIEEELLADLKLAVTEACGNVVRHAYPGDEAGDVSLVVAIDDSRLLLTVEDYGAGIRAPDSPEEADELSGPLESGMGMPIIRAIVDELAVEEGSDGRGTVVRMVKYLAPAAL